MAAHNRDAVVIRNTTRYPTYRYCLRSHGRFRHLVSTGPYPPAPPSFLPQRITLLTLSGRYVAYAYLDCDISRQVVPSGNCLENVEDVDLQTDASAGAGPQEVPITFPHSVLLAPTGVAAWISADGSKSGPFWTLHAVDPNLSPGSYLLDSIPYSATGVAALANLQLYHCAAGCVPNTTVVAWTHNGEQRYAQISP